MTAGTAPYDRTGAAAAPPLRLLLVGGFLGAGKTTLLAAASRRLAERGFIVGLVTNDQAEELVDTALLARDGTPVEEVAGSCFCCNYDGLLGAVTSLADRGASAVIAEPVGSCADLSATILQPTKDTRRDIHLAPFSVLVEPDRLEELENDRSVLHVNARYIADLQLKEADRIVLTKVDTLSLARRSALRATLHRRYPGVPLSEVSAVTGDGIESWLDQLLAGGLSGERLVDVDYDRYAEGEAVLGWFNANYHLAWTDAGPHWRTCAATLMSDLQAAFQRESAAVGHLKLLMSLEGGSLAANLTSLSGLVNIRTDGALTAQTATLIVNARVQMAPAHLSALVESAMSRMRATSCAVHTAAQHSLSAARPQPTHRYDHVVSQPAHRYDHVVSQPAPPRESAVTALQT